MNFVSKAEVIQITNYNNNIKEYLLRLDKDRKYAPGSFVQLTLELVTASDIWPESRTFSIASYQKGLIRLIVKNVGVYTNKIFNELKLGDYCTVKYPFGELFKMKTVEEKHIFIAGGLGITPYLGLVQFFKSVDRLEHVNLMYSAKYLNDLIYLSELKEVLTDRLQIFITQESSEEFINRRIEIKDVNKIADKNTNIYICGSKTFNKEIHKILVSYGYNRIHMDDWE